MFRNFLVAVGLVLVGIGGLYCFGLIHAGYDTPEPATIAEVLAERPMLTELNVPFAVRDKNRPKRIRVAGVEIDRERRIEAKGPGTPFSYAPVKSTDDRVYVRWFEPGPASDRFTLIGSQHFVVAENTNLPVELIKQLKDSSLYIITYDNQWYWHNQFDQALVYFVLGGVPLGAAVLLALVGLARTAVVGRRVAAATAEAAARPVGPCAVCGCSAPLLPVVVAGEHRTWAGPRAIRVKNAYLDVDVCPKCSVGLGDLWKPRLTVGMILPFCLLFGGIGIVLAYVGSSAGLILAIASAGLLILFYIAMNRRYDKLLGPLHVRIKQSLGVTYWNPLSHKISCRTKD